MDSRKCNVEENCTVVVCDECGEDRHFEEGEDVVFCDNCSWSYVDLKCAGCDRFVRCRESDDGEFGCEVCLAVCEFCEEIVICDEVDGVRVCPVCFGRHYFRCDKCLVDTSMEYCYTIDRYGDYCEECYGEVVSENELVYCEDCGEVYEKDEVSKVVDKKWGEVEVCESCRNWKEDNGGLVTEGDD